MVMRVIMMRTVWTCMLCKIKYIPDTYDFMLLLYVSGIYSTVRVQSSNLFSRKYTHPYTFCFVFCFEDKSVSFLIRVLLEVHGVKKNVFLWILS